MTKKLLKRNEGFTIIEVMIVLAIAGLILLIVFLAVPALQRTARNTSRKNDASAVLGAFSNYVDNNGGTIPTFISFASPNLSVCAETGCTGGTDAVETAKIGYYTGVATQNTAPTKGQVSVYATYAAPPATALDAMIIEEGAQCTNATTVAASNSARAYAAVYGVETSSGFTWNCTGS